MNEKNKIVMIGRYNDSNILTGIEKAAHRIFSQLTTEHKDIEFVEYFYNGRQYSTFKKLFGKEEILSDNQHIGWRLGLVRLFFFLVNERPFVVHLVTFETFYFAVILFKILLRFKIIYTHHYSVRVIHTLYRKSSIGYRIKAFILEALLHKIADKIVFVSQQALQIAKSFYSLSNDRVVIIPNGIDEEFSLTSKQKSEKGRKLNVIFVGDIGREEKGFVYLLSSISTLTESIQLHVVGKNDPTASKLKENIIFYEEFVPNNRLADLFSRVDVYISASSYDTFSLAAVEAMSVGLAVIVTKETGMSDLIKNGKNGIIVNYGDQPELRNVLQQFIDQPDSRYRLGNEARKIYTELSWKKIAEKYGQLYFSI